MRIWENIKSLFLCFLIGLSVYLTGSLWFDNYQGLSLVLANFPKNLRDTFITEEVEYSKKYAESIVPYKLTIASPDNGKWVLYYDSPDVKEAWNLVKAKFDHIGDKTEVIIGNISEWKDLIHRKSIILEFGNTVDVEILKLILPNLTRITQPDFNNINKIAITKSIDGAIVYVDCKIDDRNLLYKILLKEEMADIENFIDGYIDKVADAKYVTLEETGTTKFYSERSVEPNTDVLFPISNKVNLRDYVKKLSVNEYFKQNNAYSADNLAMRIFQNTDYAKFITSDNGNIYINDDKSYVQISADGLVEYINKGKTESAGNISSTTSYNIALSFIDMFNVYDDIYLLSAKRAEEEYDFRFFLAIDGVPMISSEEIIEDDFRAIVQIKVKNGSVSYFKGKLIRYDLENQSSYVTNLTSSILNELIPKIPEKQTMIVNCIQMSYDIDALGENYPIWYIDYKTENEQGSTMLNVAKN